MEALTTLRKMLAGNTIFVPNTKSGYSWRTEFELSTNPQEVNVFLSTIEENLNISQKSNYYLGYFLFEEKDISTFGIIKGQDRLTTIIIFLSAIFTTLKQINSLNNIEIEIYEDTIKRNSKYRFNTVDTDNQHFKDYIIDKTKIDINEVITDSAKRLTNAFDFFYQMLKTKDELTLVRMLDMISNADCTTYTISAATSVLSIEDDIFQVC